MKKKILFISTGGTRTLQVYFWHRTIIYGLTYFGFQQTLARIFPNNWWLYYSLTALVVTAVLCLKIFGKPLDGIMNCVKGCKIDKSTDKRTDKEISDNER